MKVMLVVAVALALSPAAAAQQSELGGKVRSGQEVVVPATETVPGDLIASAGTVRINGRIDGDLVATGGQVTIAGTVTGDVLAAAGRTTIAGQVGGDARVASGQVTLQGRARVGEDLLVGAGQATIAPGAQLGGDLIFGTGRMTMDGAVAGNVLGSAGTYSGGGAVAGRQQVNIEQPPPARAPTLADRTLEVLRRYVSVLVVGVLGLWLLPGWFRRAAEVARAAPWSAWGSGSWGASPSSWPWGWWSWSPWGWRSCWACSGSGP